jgi:hypothetical protein
LLRLCLFLFDLDPNKAFDHCKNPSMPGPNEPKCICSRVMRSQQYRAYAVAMRVRGSGNLQLGKVLPAALRAAWNYPEYDKQLPYPTLPSPDIAAWEREPDPTMESARLVIAVLERLRVLASLTCPHPLVGQEDSAMQAACWCSELYLHVQAGGNCGSELGRFHRALTVEAHTRH